MPKNVLNPKTQLCVLVYLVFGHRLHSDDSDKTNHGVGLQSTSETKAVNKCKLSCTSHYQNQWDQIQRYGYKGAYP